MDNGHVQSLHMRQCIGHDGRDDDDYYYYYNIQYVYYCIWTTLKIREFYMMALQQVDDINQNKIK